MVYNLIIPCFYINRDVKVYLPEPLKDEILKISKVLSYFYKCISQNKEAQEALVIDWERIKDEALSDLDTNLQNVVNNNLNNFFIRCIDGLSIIDNDVLIDYGNKEIKTYLNDVDFVNRLKGTMLFILALLRYVIGQNKDIIIKSYTTSYNITEYMKHYKKQSEEYIQEKKEQQEQQEAKQQEQQEVKKVKKLKTIIK